MDIKEIIQSKLKLIESMVESGYKEKDIAAEIGIGYSTWKKYKATENVLKATIEKAKDKRLKKVEDSLYKCATGYSYYEDVPTKVKEEVLADDGKIILMKESVNISTVKKYRGPELQAIKYFLNNRNKKDWKEDPNKVEIDKANLKLKKKEVEGKVLQL